MKAICFKQTKTLITFTFIESQVLFPLLCCMHKFLSVKIHWHVRFHNLNIQEQQQNWNRYLNRNIQPNRSLVTVFI